MAVLGNRGTGLLDMLIEGFRNQGQEVITPFNMSPVDRQMTPLQRAMNRPEVILSQPGGQKMVTFDSSGTYNASPTPQVQAAVQSAAQPMSAQQLRTAMPRVTPMQVTPAQAESNVPVNRLIEGQQFPQGSGVALSPQQVEMQGRKPFQMTPESLKASEDAAKIKDAIDKNPQLESDPSFMDQVKSYFGSRENMLRLAMAFNTMRLEPDAQLTAALSKQLETVGKNTRAAQAAAQMRARGTKPAIQAAQYIEQTGDVAGGLKMFREAGRYQQLTGAQLEARGISGFDKNKVYNYDSISDKVSSIGGGDTIIDMGVKEGKLSTDYTFLRDAEGNIVYENGLPIAVPVPGSPAAQAAEQTKEKEVGRQVQRQRAGGTVIQDIQRGLDLIPELSGLESLPGVAGANARKMAEGIEGTVTNRISKFKESALSNVGLDTLQQMRENSPTGGALGQVPIQQQKRLEQVLGSLDVTQELPVLEQNMQRVINIYLDIVYGAEAERALLVEKGELTEQENAEINSFYYDLPFDPLGRPIEQEIPKPDDIDQAVWDAMKPEQKALWK